MLPLSLTRFFRFWKNCSIICIVLMHPSHNKSSIIQLCYVRIQLIYINIWIYDILSTPLLVFQKKLQEHITGFDVVVKSFLGFCHAIWRGPYFEKAVQHGFWIFFFEFG